jgi:hypothetical protein
VFALRSGDSGDNGAGLGLALQENQKIVVAGQSLVSSNASEDLDFALLPYESDGSLDSPFGTATAGSPQISRVLTMRLQLWPSK